MEDTQQKGQDKEGSMAGPGVSRMGKPTGERQEPWLQTGKSGYGGGGGVQEESHRGHIYKRSYTILNGKNVLT